ncbi:MAG: dienelactone hydrolase family protein [Alphaproteobacteria bacterium]|nr:dienelactone hydrolase family protein [Alphaproteobacteria bacterium]MCB9930453.1 dienelactone hydrolase family protein [Alphaproteobacteria bacterium]
MGEIIQLTATDGHTFDVYKAMPAGTPKGAILVIQEIFGVNAHMREVADGFAADGYAVLAPALFDRAQKDFDVGYTPEDIAAGRDMRAQVDWADSVLDMAATVEALKPYGKVGSVGYCYGGSCSWLVATRIGVAASVCYYGGQIAMFKDEKPKNPVMMHFGENDHGIPMADVDAIRAAHPDAEVFVYPAGHGFNCDHRGDYDAACAKQARERTMAFFAKHVG